MQVLGISGGLIDDLIKPLKAEQLLVESKSYPAIFKCYKDVHVELNMFLSMPMYLCFLAKKNH